MSNQPKQLDDDELATYVIKGEPSREGWPEVKSTPRPVPTEAELDELRNFKLNP